ncbi:extracellular solute-binding protein [Paenibacillus psychroresistens]|uniref:Extracellular solute-binding protein n=1 Tax=Paenibacillus psychroresistens TaxID=1778678 RepID=A0A6B8RIE6_9BACL|nr:extracellular solute-binding protein [Paenibacillus psychroresistens]QGQ95156.1 extracellular solute-binding protein [Paenibacillus psychroresistens]
MKRKRLKSSLFIGVLAMSIVATGCSTKNPGEATNTTDPAVSATNNKPVDPLAKYDPPIEVTIARAIDADLTFKDGESIDNNIWTKAMEDELGIKQKTTWSVKGSADEYNQKLSVSIAAGNLPDMFLTDAIKLKQLADAGQLEDLTELYNQYATPFTKEILGQDGGMALKSATFGGKLLAIPNTDSAADTVPLMFIRTDWLKNLNLTEPKTMDDVLKISEAFTKKDPDANKKSDTFGLALSKELFGGTGGIVGFANSYHAYPNTWVPEASGKLVYGNIQPEMKSALAKLQELYNDKQIDPEFGIKDGNKEAELTAGGKIGMFFGAMWTPLFPLQGGKDKDPNMQWGAYKIISVDDKPALVQASFPVSRYYAVKKGAKHPEALIKILNLYSEKMWGEKAEYEKYGIAKDGTPVFKYYFSNYWPARKNVDIQTKIKEALRTKDTSKLNAEQLVNYRQVFDNLNKKSTKDWGYERVFGPENDTSFAVINEYLNNKSILNAGFYGAPTPTMGEKQATLDKLVVETFTKIIMGSAPIDDFDKFVSNWKSSGGDEITKEVNDWNASK